MKPIIAATALALFGSAAAAQVPGQHFVENWDLNGDGKVTLDEAQKRRGNVFASFDANDDGFLDAEEYVFFDEARANDMADQPAHAKGAMKAAAGGMALDANDTDKDGKVSKDEFLGNTEAWIAGIDQNGDGAVTLDDFGGRGMGQGQGQQTGQGQPNPAAQRFMSNWDLNSDGVVTVDEAVEMRSDVFVSFDANEDGVIDADEHEVFDEARNNDINEVPEGPGRMMIQKIADGMARSTTDADGDGAVTRAEFEAGAETWLLSMDRNGDGVVTSADFGPQN